ncbi:MAG: RsbRD N-terminal domain-containing protein [Desulfobacteraceae bacterium]|nr:RsbRD N-terminal domain-containing protein [Desulfobacteraceae bacterium]
MSIESILLHKKKLFLQTWLELLLSGYPPETVRLLKKETNQFANPVGHAFSSAMDQVCAEFLQDNDPQKMAPLLDRILRIRAIQEFSPSQSLAFIFSLKRVVRELLKDETAGGQVGGSELAEFESKVDELGLLAFDVYMRCREDLFEVRIKEIKNRTNRLLHRAQIIAEIPERKAEEE